ncbi:MAG: cytochrome c [Candidatus Obscuribacterales bacterium]|nr:cytochrome c [Candidatus Obscuribacterales bacterium]
MTASAFLFGFQGVEAESPSALALIDKYGCRHCHIIDGVGSTLGPPLDGIGKYRGHSYIEGRIKISKIRKKLDYPVPGDLMMHVHVGDKDAKLISDYLISLRAKEIRIKGHSDDVSMALPQGSQFSPLKESDSTIRGLKLFKQNNCVACHALGKIGGHIGPDLAGVGARRSRNFIQNRISAGAIILPQPGQSGDKYAMPPAKLSAAEIEDVTNWLLTLPPDTSFAR